RLSPAAPPRAPAMTWLQRYRLRAFFKSSLWPLPLTGLIAALLFAPLLRWLDRRTGWVLEVGPDGARAVVDNLSSALLTFLVFVFSMLLLAVQLASAQLTPRIIARIFKDPVTRLTLAVFIFFYTLSLAELGRLQGPVPLVSSFVCAYGSLACVAMFVFLIDRL